MTGSRREITIMMNDTHSQLRQLSTQDFASFGLGEVAYVRPVELNGTPPSRSTPPTARR